MEYHFKDLSSLADYVANMGREKEETANQRKRTKAEAAQMAGEATALMLVADLLRHTVLDGDKQ